MGNTDVTREEILADLFARIQAVAEPESIPEHWFTQDEYAKARGLTKEKARRELSAACQAGMLERCQKHRRMWYYEKEA